MKKFVQTLLLIATAAIAVTAQDVVTTTTTPTTASSKVIVEGIASIATKVVKNSPFSAEGISESIQTLPDGNRIVRSTTTKMFRDSEGRFRREEDNAANAGFGAGGAGSVGGVLPALSFQDTISIYDPVAAVRYMLNPNEKTVRRFNNQSVISEGAVIVNGQAMSPAVKAITPTAKIQIEAITSQKANVVVMPTLSGGISGGNVEQLGTKNIEGVQVEGIRTVRTIAAGTIGNEKSIEIVYERWYSKELDLIVQSRHYDPRIGEQNYRLININRSEPDRSLFTVPADYKVVSIAPLKTFTTRTQ